ncbi:hypothetical protein BUY99_14475 [Staphylococcus gallinarum]|uniref:hypothetical protein n=1 Tax=Staphylococcus TaxID=1279 RepID=UPI000E67FBEA|nr:hypothetical protein [Staphylococcus gallinarum]RIL17612.1 hypothetical protein BUY99_14475 [Staphylococcus gallinarum]
MNLKTNESKIAYEYFYNAVIEIDDKEMFDENIKELLRYLHFSNFSINDVLEFYSFSDLQDEYDIPRLMEYLHVTDNPKESYLEEYQIDKILAQNEGGYLVLVNDTEEY